MWHVLTYISSMLVLASGIQHIFIFYKKEIVSLAGVGLQKIDIVGQNRLTAPRLFWAINIKKNEALWTMPLHAIKKRLESLPWVCSAIVQRRFPCTLHVVVKEHIPFAIWHDKGGLHLLNRGGEVIKGVSLNTIKNHELIFINGAEAPQNMTDLICALGQSPLFSQVKIASFLRSGRWDLYLKDGRLIQCPESDLGLVWDRMKAFSEVLRDASVIDLRFDHVIFYSKKKGMEKG